MTVKSTKFRKYSSTAVKAYMAQLQLQTLRTLTLTKYDTEYMLQNVHYRTERDICYLQTNTRYTSPTNNTNHISTEKQTCLHHSQFFIITILANYHHNEIARDILLSLYKFYFTLYTTNYLYEYLSKLIRFKITQSVNPI